MRNWAIVTALFLGCGPSGRTGTGNPNNPNNPGGPVIPGSFAATCNGSSTVLTGVALAPNGIDPVAAANVYLVASPNPMTAGVSCDVCGHSVDTALAEATSGNDGRFSLSLDAVPMAASVKLVIAKGRFRRVTDLPVTACQSSAVPAKAVTLPGRSADGDVPKIAVATGSKDHLDVVLDSLGIKEFDCYTGTKSTSAGTVMTPCGSGSADIETLLTDANKLAGYNMLFLSCAPGKYAALADPATVAKNLEAWVRAGGRLFATDESYDYVEQAFPPYIDFLPGTGTPATAQPVDQANLGVGAALKSGGATYMGNVVDTDLEAWLQAIGVLPPEANTITLTGFLNPWAAQKDVSKDVKTNVTATASYYTSTATTIGSPSTSATLPMTVEWDYQMCGRVLFSSYHTLPTTGQGAALSAQEKILEYLMLDIGSCLGPIG